MSTCGEVGSDVHALIKELLVVIRRAGHRSETYSNESQHLAEGTGVARLRRRFSFVLQQALSFRTRHHFCGQGVVLASTRQLRSQGPVSVHAHRTEGVTGSEGREGANGVGGGIGAGGGNGDGNGGGNGDMNGDGDGAERGTGMGVEANEGAQDRIGDGSGDGARTGTRVETRGRTRDGNGDEDSSGDRDADEDGNGNEDGIGEGGREAKKCKKPHKNCSRDQILLFRTRHRLYTILSYHIMVSRQRVVLAGTQQLRSQGLVPVYAHRTEGITGSEGREGANGVGGGIGVEGGNGDGDGDGAGTETRTEVEANEGAQNGNEDGNGDGAGTGTETRVGTGTRTGWGRVEERRRSARNRTGVLDTTWEMGETWVERGKNVEKKGLAQ